MVEFKKISFTGCAGRSNPSRNYGRITSDVAKRFQESYRLKANGIADEATFIGINNNIVKIFIDPRHGCKDSRGQGSSLDEKDIVLKTA